MGGAGWRYPTPSRPLPVPSQERAGDTVRAAVEATVELLERLPVELVTLEEIRRRSGVSQGSLTHHFGSRDGLIAAAHVERFVRMCAADHAFLEPFDGALEDPRTFVTTIMGMVDEMLSEERHAVRWVRLTAIAAAFGDEHLTRTISETYTALTSRLTAIVEVAHTSGILPPDVDARTVALLLTMHAQGLVLDDLSGDQVERSAWNHIQSRFVGAFVGPETQDLLASEADRRFGDLWRAEVRQEDGRVPSEVAARLDDLRARAASDAATTERSPFGSILALAAGRPGRVDEDAAERRSDASERLLRAAIVPLRARGSEGVVVRELRTPLGLSPQGFHRLFHTRDAFIREARVRLEITRATQEITRFSDLVAASRTPAEMRRALADGADRMAGASARTAMWQRIETIAATRTDPELRAVLGRLQRTTRDLLIEQVCLAQRRGLIDPRLPPTGVARLLDGSVFWHVFHGLDAEGPSREAWAGMLARIARLISPDR